MSHQPEQSLQSSRPGSGAPGADPQEGDQQRVVVVTQDGMGVAPHPDDDDAAANPADLVEQPAKVMRIGSMIKQLLEEVRNAPLDEAGRIRLAEIHRRSIEELKDGLAPELIEELERIALPFGENAPTASRPPCSPSRWRRRRSSRRCVAPCPPAREGTRPPGTATCPACPAPRPATRVSGPRGSTCRHAVLRGSAHREAGTLCVATSSSRRHPGPVAAPHSSCGRHPASLSLDSVTIQRSST